MQNNFISEMLQHGNFPAKTSSTIKKPFRCSIYVSALQPFCHRGTLP